MAYKYNPKRTRNLFKPDSDSPYALSRSKIDLFLQCQKCFYLDRRLGVARPPGFPFNLNNAVDALLKKEFDVHRRAQTPHPMMIHHEIPALPLQHRKLHEWRHNFTGIRHVDQASGFEVFGAVDDLWRTQDGEVIVVDYKATSKEDSIDSIPEWAADIYRRQMEVYQWLLRKNGLKVSSTGYFLFCNGQVDRAKFEGKLDFEMTLVPCEGNDEWIEPALMQIKECLMSENVPMGSGECEMCLYREAAREVLHDHKMKHAQESLF